MGKDGGEWITHLEGGRTYTQHDCQMRQVITGSRATAGSPARSWEACGEGVLAGEAESHQGRKCPEQRGQQKPCPLLTGFRIFGSSHCAASLDDLPLCSGFLTSEGRN